jgi:hypothetical protein
MKTENGIRFVVKNHEGEYWSKYKVWASDIADAYLFSDPSYARRSLKYAHVSSVRIEIEKVQVVFNVLDSMLYQR